MLHLFVNAEGGLTAAGYALSAGLLVLSLLTGLSLAERGERRGVDARRLAYCAMAVALAYATSFIKVFQLPYGGSVTLLSMLFIVLIANWYGVKTGLLVGFAYGILQFLQEPYVLSLFQVCCDYVLAFAALGLAGLFRGKRNGLLLGVHCGSFGPGGVPHPGRVSLLDGLHAGDFSSNPPGPIPHCLQLRLPAGRGHFDGGRHQTPSGGESTGAHPRVRGEVTFSGVLVGASYSEILFCRGRPLGRPLHDGPLFSDWCC